MLPRMTSLNKEGKLEEARKLFLLSIELIIVVAVAMACGISAISKSLHRSFSERVMMNVSD